MNTLAITRPQWPAVFGGLGFHNSEISTYRLMDKRHFDELVCKCYREISPGFMRCFAGYDDWTKEAMDDFADCYEQMEKWTDTPMYLAAGRAKLHFSEEEMERYCENVADRLEYLIKERDVKHLAYYCFSNELCQISHGVLNKNLPLFKRYHEMLYRAFQNRGLRVGLLATDASMDWSSIDWAIENMDQITKDYCGHYYEHNDNLDDLDFFEQWYERCHEYVKKAVKKEKRFILGEYGLTTGGNLKHYDGAISDVSTYLYDGRAAHSCLKHAEMVAASVNAGVHALAHWTFVDYPDPMVGPSFSDEYNELWSRYEPFGGGRFTIGYNKWGLLRWEEDGDHSPREHYWCVGMMSKYLKRNSRVLHVDSSNPLIRACAVYNRDRSVSAVIINRSKEAEELAVTLPFASDKPLRLYEYDTHNPPYNRFADLTDPVALCPVEDGVVKVALKPESVYVLTSDYLEKAAPVEAEILGVEGGVLRWAEVSDPNHCYYRVFDAETGEQIASTIALECDAQEGKTYRVLSVDRSGNI